VIAALGPVGWLFVIVAVLFGLVCLKWLLGR
jgi:hypothetical protein